jgi:hypothetical protein
LVLILGVPTVWEEPNVMAWVQVAKDKKGFVLAPFGRPFVPRGLNYDPDNKGG